MPTYKLVPELKGIEIYFEKKPDYNICNQLKENGWRWHPYKRCWYNRMSNRAESMAQELCYQKTDPSAREIRSVPVEINQFCQGHYVSTVTITPTIDNFIVTSTNNMIICADCKYFYSVHASSCPHCGCPLKYTAEQLYKFHHPDAQRARKLQEEKELREYKLDHIQELKNCCSLAYNYDRLMSLSRDAFDTAWNRAMDLVCISEELPSLPEWLWWELITMDDDEYKNKLIDLKEELAREKIQNKANKVLKEVERLRLESLLKNYNVSLYTLELLISSDTSYDDVVRRLDLINYYMKKYPQMGLSIDTHITYPYDPLKQQIQQLIQCGKTNGEIYLCDYYSDEAYEDIPF